ncbi:hypothetical protein LOAG_04749 [Loa loa]|uniref:Uncharacterized protein n=1 Tax=Loa loa TaxID=7209 RepID=A0A1S0U1I5_LOALO|nr:hypothetical protein LOAG_04749 [Loa loa]EFO23739.1 hypothetical protein LOAG_04749 [Loa loa]
MLVCVNDSNINGADDGNDDNISDSSNNNNHNSHRNDVDDVDDDNNKKVHELEDTRDERKNHRNDEESTGNGTIIEIRNSIHRNSIQTKLLIYHQLTLHRSLFAPLF